jgi:superfamily I DNA/RNA helicase
MTAPLAIYVPSPQQAAFIHEAHTGTSSIVLIAVAGAGKTTTILQAVKKMRGQTIILAFNKKIAEEIKAKLKRDGIDWKKAEAATTHSIGLRNWKNHIKRHVGGEVMIQQDKVGRMIGPMLEHGEIDAELKPFIAVILQLVTLAKANAIGIVGHIEDESLWEDIVEHFDLFDDKEIKKKGQEIIETAIMLLKKSNDELNVIDFDDMIYLPLLYDITFFQFDNVIMDEAQDSNLTRQLLADALLKRGGRFMGVGDPRQAIYGFTGADNDSMDNLKQHFRAKEMPLTVTYRCPKAVVKFAQTWVDHIQAHETAPDGEVAIESFETMLLKPEMLNGDAAILCRNTRPLVTAAFALIRAKIPCRIEGRDIGEQLVKLVTRWKSISDVHELEDKLVDWLEAEEIKWTEKKKLAKVQEAQDKVETIRVIIEACLEDKRDQISDVVAYIDNIFADNVTGILTLSTIHRSKGREWKTVYWLDRFNTCPSRFATMEWEQLQEANLCYVAATRSMGRLVDLFMPLPKQKAVNDNAKPAPAVNDNQQKEAVA